MKKMLVSLVVGMLLMGCAQTELVVIQGEKGEMGPRGETGAPGMSAYELALRNGFVGTESEYLQSLVGADGSDGKSAYELYVEVPGNEDKSFSDFLESLKGVPGVQGPQGVAGVNGSDGTPGQSCSVSKTGTVTTVSCGLGNSVTINDGISPTVNVSSATSCTYGGVTINGTTSCFNGSSIVANNTRVVKLCKDSSKNSQEYGLVINNELYAVFHSERCNQGNGVAGTQDVNGLYACRLDAEQNSKMSNTYLAKLTLGSTYVTTDGTECNFTASLN